MLVFVLFESQGSVLWGEGGKRGGGSCAYKWQVLVLCLFVLASVCRIVVKTEEVVVKTKEVQNPAETMSMIQHSQLCLHLDVSLRAVTMI